MDHSDGPLRADGFQNRVADGMIAADAQGDDALRDDIRDEFFDVRVTLRPELPASAIRWLAISKSE